MTRFDSSIVAVTYEVAGRYVLFSTKNLCHANRLNCTQDEAVRALLHFLTRDKLPIHDEQTIYILTSSRFTPVVDPTEPSDTSSAQQLVQGIVNGPQLPEARASSQLFLVE
jgi:hypothetical protein